MLDVLGPVEASFWLVKVCVRGSALRRAPAEGLAVVQLCSAPLWLVILGASPQTPGVGQLHNTTRFARDVFV